MTGVDLPCPKSNDGPAAQQRGASGTWLDFLIRAEIAVKPVAYRGLNLDTAGMGLTPTPTPTSRPPPARCSLPA